MSGRGKTHAFGLVLFALGLAGCSGKATPLKDNDPLVGGKGAVPTEGTARGNDPVVPPIPSPTGSTVPAGMAGGSFTPLEGDRGGLRIGDDRTAGNGGRAPSSGVSLVTPRPLREGVTAPTPPSLSVPSPTGSGDLLQVLVSRGVKGLRLEQNRETGQWRCLCSIPDKQNPSLRQNYEATAGTYQEVLQSILDKADGENR